MSERPINQNKLDNDVTINSDVKNETLLVPDQR